MSSQPLDESKGEELSLTISLPPNILYIKNHLLAASKNLVYISESDEPFEFVFFPSAELSQLPETGEEFASLVLGRDLSTLRKHRSLMTIEDDVYDDSPRPRVLDFDEFFTALSGDRVGEAANETPLQEDDPYTQTLGYGELKRAFKRSFTDGGNSVTLNEDGVIERPPTPDLNSSQDFRIYRVPLDKTRIEIFIVGLVKGVGVVGVKTLSIET
ncbi:hypothetical protein G9A89_009682 [Geosiphon pyriformis]|nr:hypothetical protein G9A89_009682 [Geosiphon pyriformis]